jgi:predicted AlkP superfamily phosphohydrolase/phosphomutase
MNRRVLVIGLDCAPPALVFNKWRDRLPNLNGLMASGVYGRLESTVPPITIPAWTCMMTSKSPGRLGIYGFRNRQDHSYDRLTFANSLMVKEDAVWDILSRQGRKVVLLGVPQTYPPKPVNGNLVSCFLAPDTKSNYTYPASLKEEIRSWVGEYLIDVDDFRTEKKKELLARIYEMTEKRFEVARHLATEKEWDFFMMVEMGIDRIHHAFWKYSDPAHALYEPGSEFEHAIRDYYVYVDRKVGDLLSLIGGGATVLVVSDHGAKAMAGGVCVNEGVPSSPGEARRRGPLREGKGGLAEDGRLGGGRILFPDLPQRQGTGTPGSDRSLRLRADPDGAERRARGHRR